MDYYKEDCVAFSASIGSWLVVKLLGRLLWLTFLHPSNTVTDVIIIKDSRNSQQEGGSARTMIV